MIIMAMLPGKATLRCYVSYYIFLYLYSFFSFFFQLNVYIFILLFFHACRTGPFRPRRRDDYKLTRISLGSFPFNFLKHNAPPLVSGLFVLLLFQLHIYIYIYAICIHCTYILFSLFYIHSDLFMRNILTLYSKTLDNNMKSIHVF